MPVRRAVPIVLADLAAEQWGLFTTAQARQRSITAQVLARLAEQGVLERLRQGVYRIGGTPPGPADQLNSAWLALQPTLSAGERLAAGSVEVVSHRSAAQLHRLGDLNADRLEFITPTRRQSRRTDVVFHRAVVGEQDWTVVDGLPVTTVLRTIADLAGARLDGGHLAGVVRDALTTLQLDPELIIQTLRPYAHEYGAPLGDGEGLLTDLLQQAGVSRATHAAAELGAQRSDIKRATQVSAGLRESIASLQSSPGMSANLKVLKEIQSNSNLAEALRVLDSPGIQAALRALQAPHPDAHE